MAQYKIISQQEYIKKGLELFGSDFNQWVFVCPICETEQNFWLHSEILGIPHEQITPHNTCVKGCEVLTREFKTVVCYPGVDVEVFEFGESIKYKGDRKSSLAANSQLIGQRRQAKKCTMPSDFTIASQARKTSKTFREVKKYHIKRVERKKVRASLIRREKYHKAKQESDKLKYSLPKECEAEKAKGKPIGKRLTEQPITNHMQGIFKIVEARQNRTIEEQLKAAKQEQIQTIINN